MRSEERGAGGVGGAAGGAGAGAGAGRAPARGGWAAVRDVGLDLLSLLWPSACVGCGAPDRELCAACVRALRVGAEEPPLRLPGLGIPGYAAGRYEGVLRSVLLAYKNRGAYRYERHLGRRLAVPLLHLLEAECWPNARRPRVALVPLPSRRRSELDRGFRHVDVIARRALRTLGAPGSVALALRATRGRTGQVGLDPRERERNARRVRVRRGAIAFLTRVPVVLVDDVSTTGATLRAATEVLEASGVRVIGALTLCLAERRDAPQNLEWNLTGERG